MTKKNHKIGSIRPDQQRTIAKMGRVASGAGKTIRGTQNSKEINHNRNGG